MLAMVSDLNDFLNPFLLKIVHRCKIKVSDRPSTCSGQGFTSLGVTNVGESEPIGCLWEDMTSPFSATAYGYSHR